MGLHFIDEAIMRAADAGHLDSAAAAKAAFWEGWREAAELFLLNFRDLFEESPKTEAVLEFLDLLCEQEADAASKLSEIYCGDPRELE